MSIRLNKRITVFDKRIVENELGEETFNFIEVKKIWAAIKPTNGSKKERADSSFSEVNIKIIIRKNSLLNINNSMYFLFKEQRYDIEYFIPVFNNIKFLEIYCRLVIE